MKTDREVIDEALEDALAGEGAHVEAQRVFDGLDWRVAARVPEGAPHSVFQVLNHMIFWQDWAVRWLDGRRPPLPRHATGSWPGPPGPRNRADWTRQVDRFRRGLAGPQEQVRKADPFTTRNGRTRLGMLRTMASHTSYHVGQVVALRQIVGSWPPPSGGLTW